jgi:DNA-binding beta-propeller fold protein YncE
LKLLAEPLGSRHRLTWLVGAIALVSCVLLGVTARAHASETIYWDNYDAEPVTIGFANIDGTGGGQLSTSAAEVGEPEGLAYDPVNGRIYIADYEKSRIDWVAVDGSGSGVLDTGSAVVKSPDGIAVDPTTQTVYWANDVLVGSIGYASANGGSGGVLNTTGATAVDPYKVALDTVNGRVYWAGKDAIYYANLDNSGGGTLSYAPGQGPIANGWTGVNVDPAAGRLYFIGESPAKVEGIYWFNTSGVGGGEVALSANPAVPAESLQGPFGLSFDPTNGRFLWGNFDAGKEGAKALGTATLNLAGSSLLPVTTNPVNGPQDAIVLKSPSGTAAPTLSQQVTALSCSQGSWSQDYPGSYVWSAPLSYSYQWSLNGQAISGATTTSLTATSPGSYACTVTGTNRQGSASQTSTGATVSAATLSATLQTKKPHAKAGKAAVVKLLLANAGDLSSAPVKVCAAPLTKAAKKGLKAPKCATVAALSNGGSAVATLSVKTQKAAKGAYKFTALVKGATVTPVTVSVKVTAAKKKHHHKKHGKK